MLLVGGHFKFEGPARRHLIYFFGFTLLSSSPARVSSLSVVSDQGRLFSSLLSLLSA